MKTLHVAALIRFFKAIIKDVLLGHMVVTPGKGNYLDLVIHDLKLFMEVMGTDDHFSSEPKTRRLSAIEADASYGDEKYSHKMDLAAVIEVLESMNESWKREPGDSLNNISLMFVIDQLDLAGRGIVDHRISDSTAPFITGIVRKE